MGAHSHLLFLDRLRFHFCPPRAGICLPPVSTCSPAARSRPEGGGGGGVGTTARGPAEGGSGRSGRTQMSLFQAHPLSRDSVGQGSCPGNANRGPGTSPPPPLSRRESEIQEMTPGQAKVQLRSSRGQPSKRHLDLKPPSGGSGAAGRSGRGRGWGRGCGRGREGGGAEGRRAPGESGRGGAGASRRRG